MSSDTSGAEVLLAFNGRVRTLDDVRTTANAFACRGGRFIDVGDEMALRERYPDAELLDLEDRHIYPGFIDPHAHFLWQGMESSQLDLRGLDSPQALLERLATAADQALQSGGGDWITGRGWDQERWKGAPMPDRKALDSVVADRPVLLTRIDGHAALANTRALELGGLLKAPRIEGGSVEQRGGLASGLLIDLAIDPVRQAIPRPGPEQWRQAAAEAAQTCLSYGLCSVHDMGLDADQIEVLIELDRANSLPVALYAMLHPGRENREKHGGNGPVRGERLAIGSFKYYADGALGSRGARLLAPYADADTEGIWLMNEGSLQREARLNFDTGFQMSTHAIGDAAVRRVLDVYESCLPRGNDRRWRIEHAQMVHPDDRGRFKASGIVPSVQAVHGVSDCSWAIDRLGAQRLAWSYPVRDLLEECGWLANGSDFPIEHPDPLRGFVAAVARCDRQRLPEGGFLPDQAISRSEALRAMTVWAARAAFEEEERGRISPGLRADYVALDVDLEQAPLEDLCTARVRMTATDGQVRYRSDS